MERVTQQLKRIRQESGMTQVNVADQAGVSAASLSRYESNKLSPTVETLMKWCSALGARVNINIKDGEAQNQKHS